VNSENFPSRLDEFEEILLADQYRVRGFSVRNRTGGIGTPLICVRPLDTNLGIHLSVPATILLRAPLSLAEVASGQGTFSLELYSDFHTPSVTIGGTQVPLELDLTTFRAYTLSQSKVWKLGRLQFLAPSQYIPSHLILNQPFEPNRIPVVYVHGTFSTPIAWAEIANTLTADPVLRQHYQIWAFFYGSGNPFVYSIADLRSALTAKVRELDPQGTNEALRQMVIIGHSQGGLVTKGTVIDTGDRMWRQISKRPLEDLNISEARREELRRLLFLKPLPFVKRVIFVSTPHRGSFLANSRARRLAQRLVSLPGELFSSRTNLLALMKGTEMGEFLHGRMPTSLDSMSPENPALQAMAKIPVAPSVKAHSIIPVLGKGDYRKGNDGVVTYQSAHVDYVQSDLVVHGKHSCLNLPATIEEVRRILYLHLSELK
jgi:pimeloyl-ACP methyl ester carboxylesterase